MEKIVIFGASVGGERGLHALRRKQKAIAFSDNDAAKHGTRILGLPVVPPSEVPTSGYDRVLVASGYYSEIFEQLVKLGVPAERIDILDHDLLEGREEVRPVSDTVLAVYGVAIMIVLVLAGYGLFRLVAD